MNVHEFHGYLCYRGAPLQHDVSASFLVYIEINYYFYVCDTGGLWRGLFSGAARGPWHGWCQGWKRRPGQAWCNSHGRLWQGETLWERVFVLWCFQPRCIVPPPLRTWNYMQRLQYRDKCEMTVHRFALCSRVHGLLWSALCVMVGSQRSNNFSRLPLQCLERLQRAQATEATVCLKLLP